MKVFDNYFGGKEASGVYQQIINCIRPHDIYMELFLGNGAVYRYKKPARCSNILNDLSCNVYARWMDSGISLTPKAHLLCCDTIEFLTNYVFDPKLRYCIYLDPPYPLTSRKSHVEVYEHEMTDEQHLRLLEVITSLPSNVDVLISTYKNPIYEKCLKDWHLKKFPARTRTYTATEYLYLNYDPDLGDLHEFTFLGKNFTERQRIKRKIERHVERLNSLPVAERKAIIEAVSKL